MLLTEGNNRSAERSGTIAAASSAAMLPDESTAGIVHDLGNLIQMALSAVNIAMRNPGIQAGDLAAVVAGAQISLERAGTLARKSIGRAREPSGNPQHVSVARCLAEVEALIRVTWGDHIRLTIDANADLPPVSCDPLGLQNAVLNLLLNARDAMPDGGVIVVRAVATTPRPGATFVEIRVADSGIGMKPETVERAFEPFFTTKPEGLGGVGLPMVRRFVEDAMGGLHIESAFGVGTTVTLSLPAQGGPHSPPES